ncbi:TonB-dependent receptor [Mucilaginibacter sp. JRF]|uniref:TonB-dependent receptor domain-containing protein n=1 Tax=Mucilaginibacter sp. JRF TaxID=2780088 RepID=UPI0018820FE9|nr:TonB-dependent receptor [Mucilaginibacter sp. JRF]MBE9583416.1 TonB-dependent receptor [Mucilaginibacter sp. JRF]
MKQKLLLISIFYALATTVAYGQQTTKDKLKKTKIDHFFTCSLDQFMDTIANRLDITIVFERDSLSRMDVNEHFFNESMQAVLKQVCRENDLQYWIENDGTVYILQQPDDLPRLQQLYKLQQTARNFTPKRIPEAKHAPKHFMFALSGRVTDQKTGEALPGATVKVRGTELAGQTNTSGNFTILNIPSDTSVVEVTFVGYQPDYFRLDSSSVKRQVSYGLFPAMNNTISEVNITGRKKGVLNTDSRKVSVLQLTPAALNKLPNIGERDIMRAFQLMPGVSATNESSSGAYVRGGTPDQNLVTFDGFTVYQVDHLYGFFSAFNSNAVRDVELYKGGYSAKYGGRLSSVTEIRGKDGNKKEANIGGDLSLLSTNIYAETPIGEKSSALVAFRRSYQGPLYDKIFGQFNTSTANNGPGGSGGPTGGAGGGMGGGPGGFANQTTPSSYFYDLNAKYNYAINGSNNISWSFYNGADKLDNSREMTLPSFQTSSGGSLNINDNTHYGNTGSSLKWTTSAGQLFGSTVASYSGFFSDRNRGTTGTITDSNTTTTINNGILEKNKLRDFSLKSDWEWQIVSPLKVNFGGFATRQSIDYTYVQNDTTSLIDQHNSGITAGGFVELEIDPNDKLHIQPGFRTTYFTPTAKMYYEPRLSLTYKLTDRITVKGATGRYYQFTSKVTREDVAGGDRNFWVLANDQNIPVGKADHFIGGIGYETNDWLFDVEGYYKKLSGLTEYSIRQQGGGMGMGGPFGGGNTTTTITENFYNGSGYAKGLEFLLQKKAGMYNGWLSYTLAEAKNKFDNYGTDYFPANQDITHEFKAVNMYHWQRWSFAATFIFSTGHPYTAPVGTYTINTLDGNKINYLSVSAKNGERLPAYHRLDLSATYDLLRTDGSKKGSLGFSFFNAYNHVNTWYNEYYIRNNQVITTVVKYLGFTPNVTLSLNLK